MTRDRRWFACVSVGAVLTAAYFVVARGGLAQNLIFQAISTGSAVAVYLAVRAHRPRWRRPWLLVAAGVALWSLADLIWAVMEYGLGLTVGFPSITDLPYLAGYVLLGAGVWLLGPRVSHGRRSELLDVIIVWLSLGIAVWAWQGRLFEGPLTAATLVGIAYPLMDVLLIGAVARIAIVRGPRSPSHLLLLGGIAFTLLGDLAFNALEAHGSYASGDAIDACWLIGYVLLAAAAAHPSMRTLTRLPDPRVAALRASRGQLVALAVASTAPIGVLALNTAGIVRIDSDVLVAAILITIVNVVLLVVRVAALLGEARTTAEALGASEIRSRTILENSLAGMAMIAPDGRPTYVNPAMARMLGYASTESMTEAVRRNPDLVFADPAERRRVFARALEGEESPAEVQLQRRDGTTLWAELVMRVLRDDAGDPVQLIAIAIDVTARREADRAIAESERFAMETIDSLSAHLAILDADGTIVAVNRAWRSFAEANGGPAAGEGVNYVEVSRAAAGSEDAPPEAARVADAIEAVLNGESEGLELEYPCHSPAEQRWFTCRVLPFRGTGRGRVVVVHEDVSQRRRAEERYREIFANAAEGIYQTTADGEILVANPALASMLGYASAEALLESGASATDHHADPGARERLLAALSEGPIRDFEVPIRRLDGGLRWWSINARPVRDAAGAVAGLEGTVSDITERRKAEDRSRRQHAHLQLLQAGSAAANEAASTDEAIRTVLDEVCRRIGWPLAHAWLRPDPMSPLVSSDIWYDEDPVRFEAFREVTRHAPVGPGVGLAGEVLAKGLPEWAAGLDEDSMFTRAPVARTVGLRTGFAFPVRVGREVAAVLEFFTLELRPRDDELLRVLGDLGNQLGRVVERARAEHSLRDAYEREREAGQRLLALDEMKNSILTAVSHELRTPLTAVYGFAELLESEGSRLSPQDHAMVTGRLAENARRLERLLSDLLDLDRLTRGIVEPRLEAMDLSLLAHRVVRESGAFETGRLSLHAEPVTIAIDRARVERILENLVSNALRYSPNETMVEVSVVPAEGGARLTVEDRGPGVPEDLKKAIFEPFRHGPNALSHSPGIGIGLSLVARFASLHGGSAWVEDREGGGARFVVFLPDRREAVLPAPDESAGTEPAPAEGARPAPTDAVR